jgi:hypothetical protein
MKKKDSAAGNRDMSVEGGYKLFNMNSSSFHSRWILRSILE